MHEIVLVYEARLSDASRYDVMTIEGADNGVWMEVLWKPVADFERGQARLYPLGLLQLITP